MKLTKSKLKQIIKEKIEESFRSPEEPEWDQFDVLERFWGSHETMTKEDLEGVLRDAGLSIVPSDYIGGTSTDDLETQAHEHEQGHWMEQKMKLTKSKLQQIIKEELGGLEEAQGKKVWVVMREDPKYLVGAFSSSEKANQAIQRIIASYAEDDGDGYEPEDYPPTEDDYLAYEVVLDTLQSGESF